MSVSQLGTPIRSIISGVQRQIPGASLTTPPGMNGLRAVGDPVTTVSTTDFSINNIVEYAKANPLHAAAIALVLYKIFKC